MKSMSAPYRSWVEVSRAQIAANFRAVCKLVGDAVEVMPVVKADAYRHGALEVSRVLVDQGARWLAVSNVEEGVALRQSGIAARILVMADYLPAERSALSEYNLTPVIHCLEDLPGVGPMPYHLKIDSGMGRLGTRASAQEIAAAIEAASQSRLEALMTHFASSADYSGAQTDQQAATFRNIVDHLHARNIAPPYVHMSSTNPVAFGRKDAWRTMVRPGHAIYGYLSPGRGGAPASVLKVAPALTWKAAILAVKDVPEGALIGYGGMFRAPRPMRIAVLSVGYADGLPHRLSNRGKVIAAGKLAPILGAVSMDLTTIDISHAPQLQVGDAVTLLGREGDVSLDAQQIARVAGTISYSVLCGISARVKRVYV
jgi:alanine racemase